MPTEEEQQQQQHDQQNEPRTDERQASTPQQPDQTTFPNAAGGKPEEPEPKPNESALREETESDKSDAPTAVAGGDQPQPVQHRRTPERRSTETAASPVGEQTKSDEPLPPETPPVEERVEPKVQSSSTAKVSLPPPSGERAVEDKVLPTAASVPPVEEEDDDEDDDEEEGGDNEEQREERGGSGDRFNNDTAAHNAPQQQQHQHHHNNQQHNRQDQAQTPTGAQYYEDDEEDEEDEGEERSELRQLFEPINDSQAQSEDEEDGDYIPDEEVKKTIMVGSDFQAVIPEGLCRYDDALPYENEDKLLWNPTILNEQEIVDYLLKLTGPTVAAATAAAAATAGAPTTPAAAGGGTGGAGGGAGGAGGVGTQQQKAAPATGAGPDPQTNSVYAIPLGNHLRDDEQSLYLLQQCGHNIDEALRRRRISNNAVPVPDQQMSIWSEEECRNFENGLRVHGKDFHMIQQTKVRTRSVGELVQFYYLWKKTERHDLFASKARLEKKKYNLHPGLTDHMDRFLEEQENSTGFGDRSSSPGFSTLYSGASEAKRQRLLDSKENNNTASSKRSASNL